jgi:hypothetical protein
VVPLPFVRSVAPRGDGFPQLIFLDVFLNFPSDAVSERANVCLFDERELCVPELYCTLPLSEIVVTRESSVIPRDDVCILAVLDTLHGFGHR